MMTLRQLTSVLRSIGVWVFLVSSSCEGEIPEITTDRPDQTESSSVLPPGYFQIETGWTHTDDDEDGEDFESDALPEALLRYGFSERLELRFGHSGHTWEEVRFSDGTPSEDRAGWQDSEVGLKYQLWLEQPDCFLPEAALLTHFSLPTGADSFSTHRADPSFRFLFSHTLTGTLSLSYNLGAAWETQEREDGDRDTLSVFQYTVSVAKGVTDKLGLFVELFGDIPMSVEGTPENLLDGGVTYLLADNLQMDFSIGVGLSEAADDLFFGTGVSYRWPD